ncbi:MAG: hypothetical protein AAF916_10195 [Planctomycetota bacterium]
MELLQVVGWTLLAAVGFWLWLSLWGLAAVALLNAQPFASLEDPEAAIERASGTFAPGWLDRHGFEADGATQATGMLIVRYRGSDGQTDLAWYTALNRTWVEFRSELPGNLHITTNNSNIGVSLPLPTGTLIQYFPERDIDALLRTHRAALAFIHSRFGIAPVWVDSLEHSIRMSTHASCAEIMMNPKILLALPYRNFVGKHRFRNQTIEEQFQRGLVRRRHVAAFELTQRHAGTWARSDTSHEA